MTAPRGLPAWLVAVDWLTTGAFLLTIGSFLGAVLDSYTSLCVVGGDLAHIGQASSCPDVHGWDTRTFPLAVDMGWGGALLATIKLARTIGLDSWRWWAVLVFEVLVAGTTVGGNAVHGAVVAGSANHLLQQHPTAIAGLASAVPGVVAVGAGFTLSVLISTRHVGDEDPVVVRPPAPAVRPAAPQPSAVVDPVGRTVRRPRRRPGRDRAVERQRPPIDRLVSVIEDLARERSIAAADVPPADALDRLGSTGRSAITGRAWVRAAKAAIADRATPLAVVREEGA